MCCAPPPVCYDHSMNSNEGTAAKVHAALASISWTEYQSVEQVAEVAGLPRIAVLNSLRGLVRRGYVKESYRVSAAMNTGPYSPVFRIIRRKYNNN